MPAGIPGDTPANNLGNPTLGTAIAFNLLSGPKGSPMDRDGTVLSWDANNHPVYTAGTPTNASTGALSTGIGFGANKIFGAPGLPFVAGGTLLGLDGGLFTDNYTPGATKPDGTATADSTYMHIGGGRSNAPVSSSGGQDGRAVPNPYTAGYGIGVAGAAGARDAGAGPAFTGFAPKSVTATAGVANGAAVETGFSNRSGVALVSGQSVFGPATAASAAVA